MSVRAEFEWLDGSIKKFNRFSKVAFSRGANIVGNFSLTMPDNDDALDILMGSNLYLYVNDQRVFGGRTQFRNLDEGTSITITGTDFNGLLALRKIDYDSINAIESSALVKLILQRFVRDPSETLPLFNIDYDDFIYETTTSKRWQYTKTSVFDICVGVANVSVSKDGKIGYHFFVDPFLKAHLEPLGANRIYDKIPFTKITFGEDHRDIKNIVEYFGGKEKTVPVVPDSWTDLGNSADWNIQECADCQTNCQTTCEIGPCQTCGQAANMQGACDLSCQAPSESGMLGCDPTCEVTCQYTCQQTCQICSDGGNLVGI